MIKRLFSHTAIYGLAPHIVKIASFFSLPLITSQLTELDYGVSGVLGAYTSAISVFSTLGLNVILVNSFFKSSSQYKWAWRQLYGFLNIWNLFYALILAIFIKCWATSVFWSNVCNMFFILSVKSKTISNCYSKYNFRISINWFECTIHSIL
jgi:hypothetical protein